jgi:hypothetical protein
MDRSDPQVANFSATTLAALDDDALAALANKGLVRRARKDLDKAPPTITAADAESVSLDVEGSAVRLTSPINKSTCACASGFCRHVIGAVIFLRDTVGATLASPSSPGTAEGGASVAPTGVGERLLAIDEATLTKWATKPLMKRAAVALARGYAVEETPAAVIVRLTAQNITVRWVGGAGVGALDAMICTCHAPGACEHKTAAVLAYQAHKTGRAVELSSAALQASSGAPRTREDVRVSVLTLLREMIALGLSRVSQATEQRLRTLATSAHGVDLPRLERVLRGLADEVLLALKRDAAASSSALLHSAARAAALCAALERPTHATVGEHRSIYMPVAGTIELTGLGARRWRTRSGYHGLTVLLWEPAVKRWTGWTDARPVGAPGFDPVIRFDEGAPWSGAASPRQMAKLSWRVSGAFRNGVGRITARENTRGIPGKPSKPDDGPLVTDFAKLATVAADAFAPGLADRRDHAELVLLAPAVWSDATYDEIQQEVTRVVADANGNVVPLVLRHSPETDHALTTLQNIDGSTVRAVLGSLRIGPQGLFVEPVTLWTEKKPIHLTLDGIVAAGGGKTSPIATTTMTTPPDAAEEADDELEDAEDAEQDAPEAETASGVGSLLARVESALVSMAESGVGVTRDLSAVRGDARELNAAGLATAAAALGRLCDELDAFRKSTDRDELASAESLLRCAYVVRLAVECQTVCEAVGS